MRNVSLECERSIRIHDNGNAKTADSRIEDVVSLWSVPTREFGIRAVGNMLVDVEIQRTTDDIPHEQEWNARRSKWRRLVSTVGDHIADLPEAGVLPFWTLRPRESSLVGKRPKVANSLGARQCC